ncbi:MAG: hypothetical protein R3D01_12010 [Hyphomicrobiales bacterium]
MTSNKKTRPQFARPKKRVLTTGETREEEEARLAAEIAAHPVTKCETRRIFAHLVAPRLEQQAVHAASPSGGGGADRQEAAQVVSGIAALARAAAQSRARLTQEIALAWSVPVFT